jgi:uncharacterized protein YjbI with pentapeptide repeats
VNKKYFPKWSFGLVYVIAVTLMNTVEAGCYDKKSPGMDWSGCKKTNKMLDDENFSGSKFDNANLSSSNLDNSNFTDASLVKADLTRASFNQSNFSGADLTKAVGYRTSAYTYLTHFENVDLRVTSELTQAQLEIACGDEKTQLPQGLVKPADWLCLE